jgi:hypothetical protein|tara:strand:- start:427 stop:666 length:240 start_codon:yes stop_codon:yes gene_type:complete
MKERNAREWLRVGDAAPPGSLHVRELLAVVAALREQLDRSRLAIATAETTTAEAIHALQALEEACIDGDCPFRWEKTND